MATSEMLVHERVKTELQGMRNRGVRRVEWKLEGCSKILEGCRLGESVDSPPFGAAGLDRIQFHFYPRGYDTSPTQGNVQPCALYISGPIRTTLKGTLSVGSKAWHLEHRFQRKGDTGGRSKFGPLEHQLDCNDSVLIALDIQEVETDMPEFGGSLCLREARPGPGSAEGE